MYLPQPFRTIPRHVLTALASLALAPILLLGCASEGPLRPPSLHLPAPAEKLSAERNGDRVILDWSTPAKTTDGELIKGSMAADVCLDLAPESAPPPPKKGTRVRTKKASSAASPTDQQTACLRVAHQPAAPGVAGQAVVEMGALATGAPRLVWYQIELENAEGRAAGVSAPVFVAAGQAPPPVAGLSVTPRREAALVAWKPEPGRATMELKRTLVATADGPVQATAARSTRTQQPFAPGAQKGPPREVVMRPDGAGAKDPGGMIDSGVRDGDSYTYVAQRVETVTLGEHKLELRGLPSAPVSFSFRDTFPPRVPTGLVLVPGGGFGEPPSIDLVWDSNIEADLLGYNVYRSRDGAAFERLNDVPLPAPSYRDMHVEPGHQYTYRSRRSISVRTRAIRAQWQPRLYVDKGEPCGTQRSFWPKARFTFRFRSAMEFYGPRRR